MPPDPIPLPELSDHAMRRLGPQQAPENPPSTVNIVTATQNSQRLLNYYNDGRIVADDVLKGELFKNKVVFGQDVIEPPWFAASMRPIREDIQTIKSTQAHIRALAARTNNKIMGSAGADVIFEIVPLLNGDDPTAPPYNLPPLVQVQIVMHLNRNQRTAYYRGYYGAGVVPPAQRCRTMILNAIGYQP